MVPGGIHITTAGEALAAAVTSPTWITHWNETLGDLTNMPLGDRIFITDISWDGTLPSNYFWLFDDIDNNGVGADNEVLGFFGLSARHLRTGESFMAFSQPLLVRYGLRARGSPVLPIAFSINAIWVPK